MTDSMIDIAAKAVCYADGERIGVPGKKTYALTHWIEYTGVARAAIEAMREPNQKMIDAYRARYEFAHITDSQIKYDYQAMIDAALEDK